MPRNPKGALHSLSARLILATVVIVVTTALVAGVPAYWLVRSGLEQQAWERVSGGGQATLALFEAERGRLADFAALTAQRPTLRDLLRRGDAAALPAYLATFEGRAAPDLLAVRDASGRALGGDSLPDTPGPPGAAACALLPDVAGLALLASAPVEGDDGGPLGSVTVGVRLDDRFADTLSAETGLGVSVLLGGQRVASSPLGPLPPPDAQAVARAAASGQPQTAALGAGRDRSYTALLPLCAVPGEGSALLEVVLPVSGLAATGRQALVGLLVSTLVVAAAISLLGALYARHLAAPLGQLTAAAASIGRGDLATPVAIPEQPTEVALLARALEESRVSTRRALDDLLQAKAWSDTLIQSIVEGIVTHDEAGRITFFSQGAERITGWQSDDALGRPLDEVLRLADAQGGSFLDHAPPSGGRRRISVLHRSGRPIALAVSGARLAPPASPTVQVVLVLRDVSEEQAVEHLRSYFLGNISHEFRTPLSALKASVELLLEEVNDLSSEEAARLLGSIHRSVTGLQTLIDNLLESARIEAGRFTIRRLPTHLPDVIDEAVGVVRPLLARRRQRLTVSQPEGLPPVHVDPTRLAQVIVNLLSNACKYGPIGEAIDLTVERPQADLLRVSVADRGEGIPPAERGNLFRRFVRLAAHDGTQYGVGLGLSVVKAIVEEHGGQVGVDERPGGGSIFWFTIPLAVVAYESADR